MLCLAIAEHLEDKRASHFALQVDNIERKTYEDGIGDLVTDLVRVTLTDGLAVAPKSEVKSKRKERERSAINPGERRTARTTDVPSMYSIVAVVMVNTYEVKRK